MDKFPPPEILVEMEPEEIAKHVLIHLKDLLKNGHNPKFHRYNTFNPSNENLKSYSGNYLPPVSLALSEAWSWLVYQGFLVSCPTDNSDEWKVLSSRSAKIDTIEDFNKYDHINLLPKERLDPILAEKVWAIFIRGDFDTAIFSAYKEVEIRIREASGLKPTDIGVNLAKLAFNPDNGSLSDFDNPDRGERVAYMELFAGSLGAFKSPSSHREVNYSDPVVATSLILHANTLLSIIGERQNKVADKAVPKIVQVLK